MANEKDNAIVQEMLSLPEDLAIAYFYENNCRIKDDSTYWNILGTLWKQGGTVIQQEKCKKLFRSKRRNCNKIMTKSERKRWRKLPKIVKAFRAVNNKEEAQFSISWTLSKEIAQRVFSENGTREIVIRMFEKKEVFAFFGRRNEEEILVNI